MGCVSKQELILSHIVIVRNQLNFTQLSKRKSSITQRKLKTSFDHQYLRLLTALFCDCAVCVFRCHCGLRGSVPKNGPIDFASKNHFLFKLCRWKGFGSQILKLDFFFEKCLILLHYGSKLILADLSLLVVDFILRPKFVDVNAVAT